MVLNSPSGELMRASLDCLARRSACAITYGAISVVAQAARSLGVRLTLRDLFEAPTIAGLTEIGTNPDRAVRWLCRRIGGRADVTEREAFLAASLDVWGDA